MPPTSLECGRQGCPGMLGRTVKEKQEADKVLAGTSCLKSWFSSPGAGMLVKTAAAGWKEGVHPKMFWRGSLQDL